MPYILIAKLYNRFDNLPLEKMATSCTLNNSFNEILGHLIVYFNLHLFKYIIQYFIVTMVVFFIIIIFGTYFFRAKVAYLNKHQIFILLYTRSILFSEIKENNMNFTLNIFS